jgi:hypothetical protein
MLTTEQSLKRLFSRRGWHKGSDLNESTARVFKMRYLENKLELETQMKVLKACGYKLKIEMQWEEEVDKEQLRKILTEKLKKENVFWSFDQPSPSEISDDTLIEKVLLHLDIDDIKILFRLFPKNEVQSVWKERMLSQEPMYHQLNRLYAFLFFGIKNPDRYIRDFKNKKYMSIQCMD